MWLIRNRDQPPGGNFGRFVRFETDHDTVRATGGHLFWVAGQGWVRARKLQGGMRIHTARGTSEIRAVTTEPDKQLAYNLIVPDFHTYFVGSDRLLSYDNTPLMPTHQTVPGLAAE